MFGIDIGIDLGTDSVLVYIRGVGVVLKEPSVVAYDRDTNQIKAIGDEAYEMIGRTPGNIVALHPLRHGVIADYSVTQRMLRYFIHKAIGRKTFRKPRVCVCVPSQATQVEKKAVIDATMDAGARDVMIIEEPMAAALGAGIDISKPYGNLVVDIGGGSTDIAIISLNDIVVSESVKVAGNDFDDAIIKYVKENYDILLGERTAQDVKKNIGVAFDVIGTKAMTTCGRNILTGLPKNVELTSDEILAAMGECLKQIVNALKRVMEQIPPELAADVANRGILLCGGGSMLIGFEELIEEVTGIRTTTADDPLTVVAIGTGRYMDFIENKNTI